MKTFTDNHIELLKQGFAYKGQNGALGMIYAHQDGRAAKISGDFTGGYKTEITQIS